MNTLNADVLMPTVNVSGVFSVVASALGVTEKEPVLPLIVTVPLLVAKSSALVNTTQYNVVPLATLVVVTLNVRGDPSLTELTVGATIYVGGGGV